MKTRAPTIKIERPARKWQHAVMCIPVPPGWRLNYTYGRFGPNMDIDWRQDNTGNLTEIVVGLRRDKSNAIEVKDESIESV